MRCNNCGWNNPETNSKCEKCGATLSSHAPNSYQREAINDVLKKTVIDAEAFGEQEKPISNVCPKCGYPMREGTTVCPQCGYGASGNVGQQPVVHFQKQETVNPYVNLNAGHSCTLTPIARADETNVPAPQSYTGESIELNRDNTDNGNMTITSKVQAQLMFENGNWYIEDKSSQKTTFVLAKEKVALKDGDVILLGNRQFVFKAE